MAVLKLVVFIAFSITVISCEDVSLRHKQQVYIAEPLSSLKQERATVVSSNLPEQDQQDAALKLQEIYDRTDEPLTRATAFMDYLDFKYGKMLNHVALNFEGATYEQKYYIVLRVADQNVLAYGQ
ncbi:hypothetical protein ILUMI_25748 [Ignelater luminosus]|uniref:Uncharacterized protein n=1 Tax=Ignelater luminosus TaxID=2038154 RepID=A0A8K0C6V5_IGNLU|nr:hypothetical protein ILUMI_25748 [Ignelater luminosus]